MNPRRGCFGILRLTIFIVPPKPLLVLPREAEMSNPPGTEDVEAVYNWKDRRIAKLGARVKELEGALRAYGVHGATCQRRQHWAGDPAYCPCTCGFECALRGENRPLDVSGPNGGENSPLERGEEKG